MSISRSDARSLSAEASKKGAAILGGQLSQKEGRFVINKIDALELLEKYAGKNIIFIIGEVKDNETGQVKTCLTCGRDYIDSECPHCARVRSRLRGSR